MHYFDPKLNRYSISANSKFPVRIPDDVWLDFCERLATIPTRYTPPVRTTLSPISKPRMLLPENWVIVNGEALMDV